MGKAMYPPQIFLLFRQKIQTTNYKAREHPMSADNCHGNEWMIFELSKHNNQQLG